MSESQFDAPETGVGKGHVWMEDMVGSLDEDFESEILGMA
jgi:hypothetical protein